MTTPTLTDDTNKQISDNSSNSSAISTSPKKNLVFLIDITGSMSSWIQALSATLPALIQSIALTRAFDTLAILGYADYDSSEVISFSGFFQANEVEGLKKFAAAMTTRGGGACEASKTGIFQLAENKSSITGKLWILHLCDQPPHLIGSHEKEAKTEQSLLKEKFDFVSLTNYLMESFPQVSYYALTTAPHSCYCYLAQKTSGHVFVLEGGTTAPNIRNQIGRVFNGWFGADNPILEHREIVMGQFETEGQISVLHATTIKCPPNVEKVLATSLLTSVGLMKTDPLFLEHVIAEFRNIITTSPMSLTCTPVLGKMWRELCKRRSDIRRDELIELLSHKKHSLNSEDKAVMDKWLTESYNSQAEIEEEIKKFIAKRDVEGLLRFVPEDDSFYSQQIVQLLASGNRKANATIRAILSRMYVDTQYKLPKRELGEDDAIPLPPSTIPLNVYSSTLFELAMHTVAPGTKLTRRYGAMLALHAIQCGSVLKERAEDLLNRAKGHWINWKRRAEDNSPEIPDNWSNSFLDLILHPSCVQFLTEEEHKQALYLKKISYLMRFFNQLEVSVKIIDETSVDGIFPDHMLHCSECDAERPLSLFSSRGQCGHCESYPKPKDTKYVSVRCYRCSSIYSRDLHAIIMGHSKCHNCRADLKASPSVTCSTCKFKFVQFYKTEEGLPDGKCGNCAAGNKSRNLQYTFYPAFANQVFKDSFVPLCASIGFKVEPTFKPPCALYDAILHISEIPPEIVVPPEKALFRDVYSVQNIDDLWGYMKSIMGGGQPQLPECAICLENFNPSEIVPACGRKGCSQRVCYPCLRAWYSKNAPGNLLYQRALLCQFCSRVPGPQILGRVDNNLIALASKISKIPLNPDVYYAWCTHCLKPKEVADRSCTTEPPKIQNYKCSDCITSNSKTVITKACPKCTVAVSKISGCNHISCACGSHWCWQCETMCKNSGEVYEHMHSVHGRIFDEDVPNYAEDDMEDNEQ